ncbi:uncharacterized protein LOC120113128 [Phoenix dactylifera]|uniref:Uncharacterized protein LOC120113128 n=1 Tax=Phoenix dactylifera TaxID=42345 RepID=A0A8B9ATT0_PHODC|nr:uncharacterized protein LOC120113128 [Phoenix dactylifera]
MGLAPAADQNFKTFQSAYPYVVQKLLYDNSASARRILYLLVRSKDGVVLRRFLMTVDATSLTGAMISKDATFFRQHLNWAPADIICHRMIKVVGWNEALG